MNTIYYIVESDKSFEQACADLEAAVARNEFGLQHIHDLGNTLRTKGFEFTDQVRIFEICNPKYAHMVMGADMRLNMALPCRISVYTENGSTKLGMIHPQMMLDMLSDDPVARDVAAEVEAKTKLMIDEAK